MPIISHVAGARTRDGDGEAAAASALLGECDVGDGGDDGDEGQPGRAKAGPHVRLSGGTHVCHDGPAEAGHYVRYHSSWHPVVV